MKSFQIKIYQQIMDKLEDLFSEDEENEAQRLYSGWMTPPKVSHIPARPRLIIGRRYTGEQKCLSSLAERKKTKEKFKTVPLWERTYHDNTRYPLKGST